MKLISFEGREGVGKSTQIDLLQKFLISKTHEKSKKGKIIFD